MSTSRAQNTVFCALDTETTGVNPVTDRIVEIGIIRFNAKGVIDSFESLINPLRDIPPAVVHIHGITNNDVKDAPLFSDLIPAIKKFIGDAVLVIQNPRFDLSFLQMEFSRSGEELPPYRAYDTVSIARKPFPDLPNHKLSTLSAYLNLDVPAHRALADAWACMEVFKRGMAVLPSADFSRLINTDTYSSKYDRPVYADYLELGNPAGRRIQLGERLTILYRDRDGIVTERNILLKQVIRRGKKTYISAHCFLRGEDRVFNIDRVTFVE